MNSRVAAISMVKDECDIIELFVKINSRKVGHIFVVDHCSTDGTAEILQKLIESGYPVTVTRYEGIDYLQSQVTTDLLHKVAQLDRYDYIIPLDADEFIYHDGLNWPEVLRDQTSATGCGRMRWVTYAPICDDFVSKPRPLFDNFRMRKVEPLQFYKVVLSNALAKRCTLAMGNHVAFVDGVEVAANDVDVVLQHVPVRTSQQIAVKALTGSHRFSIKPGRGRLEGFHWDLIAAKVREQRYRLVVSDLTEMACRYATDSKDLVAVELADQDSPRIGCSSDVVEYLELAQCNLPMQLDSLASVLCKEVNMLRRQISEMSAEQVRDRGTKFSRWRGTLSSFFQWHA